MGFFGGGGGLAVIDLATNVTGVLPAANGGTGGTSGGGVPDLPTLLWSPCALAKAGPSTDTVDETHGLKFRNLVAMTVTGVRIFTGASGNGKTFKVTLRDHGGTALATKTATGSGNNVTQEILFDSPVNIAAVDQNASQTYRITVYSNTAGSKYNVYALGAPGSGMTGASGAPITWVWAKDLVFDNHWLWGSGDVNPTNTIANVIYALEPIMTRT